MFASGAELEKSSASLQYSVCCKAAINDAVIELIIWIAE